MDIVILLSLSLHPWLVLARLFHISHIHIVLLVHHIVLTNWFSRHYLWIHDGIIALHVLVVDLGLIQVMVLGLAVLGERCVPKHHV